MKAAFFTLVGSRAGAVGVAKVQRFDRALDTFYVPVVIALSACQWQCLNKFFLCPAFFFLSIIRFFRTWLVGVCTTVQQTGIALGIVDALEILELAKRKSESGWQPGGNPTKSMLKSDDEVEQNWGKNGKRCWTRIESKFAEFVYKFDSKQKQIHLICWNSINIAICSAS